MADVALLQSQGPLFVLATWLGVMLECSGELLRSQQPVLLHPGRSVLRLLLLLLLLRHRLLAANGSTDHRCLAEGCGQFRARGRYEANGQLVGSRRSPGGSDCFSLSALSLSSTHSVYKSREHRTCRSRTAVFGEALHCLLSYVNAILSVRVPT